MVCVFSFSTTFRTLTDSAKAESIEGIHKGKVGFRSCFSAELTGILNAAISSIVRLRDQANRAAEEKYINRWSQIESNRKCLHPRSVRLLTAHRTLPREKFQTRISFPPWLLLFQKSTCIKCESGRESEVGSGSGLGFCCYGFYRFLERPLGRPSFKKRKRK